MKCGDCEYKQAAHSMEPAYCKKHKLTIGWQDERVVNCDLGEGRKDDQDKERWDLLPYDALEEVVKRYTHGAKKYAPNNWQNVPDFKARYEAALMRHFAAYKSGERMDPDAPGLTHLSAVAWNALALIWKELEDVRSK